MKISSTLFNLQFFMSSKRKVKTLKEGTEKFGGATHNTTTNEYWSNTVGNEFITVTKQNTVSIYVPTTVNINLQATQEKINHMIEVVTSRMRKINDNITHTSNGIGAWYCDALQEQVCEQIHIVSHEVGELTEKDIREYVAIAEYVRKAMSQECVSLQINKSLLLV
jgi:hypothetical protein